MLNMVLEDKIMVNQVNDSSGIKAMEINNRLKTKNQENIAPVADNVASSSDDSVNFSDISKQLEAVKASFKDMPEVNSAKVSQFKADIESGNYQINSNAIAQKMLNNNAGF